MANQQSDSGAGFKREKDETERDRGQAATARLTVQRVGDDLLVGLAGDWLANPGLPAFGAVEDAAGGTAPVKAMAFQTRDLGRWNSGLMTFILKCFEFCKQKNMEFRSQTLPAGVSALLQLAEAVPERKDAVRGTARPAFLEGVGLFIISALGGAVGMITFGGESALAFIKLLRGKAQFRWSDTFLIIEECGPKALGIVALINFLVGMILAFMGATQLQRFGASIYTADLVAIATVREMAPIMTGIIMCGRTGAAFAAQLGTMKVNQEIEAFQTFGFGPFEFLVLPRLVALIAMMPILVLFANLISILGGFLVSTSMLHVTPTLYLNRTVQTLSMTTFLLSIFKGTYFGVVVALTGCLRGMQCGTSAAAVGLATTSAVVTGITWIVASDGLFAVICNTLGI